MEPAHNLDTLSDNLLTSRRVTKAAYYVPLYEPVLDRMRRELLNVVGQEGIHFVVGQSGNGKTTALHFLIDGTLDTTYRAIYVNGRDLFSAEDVDIVDLLLLIGRTLTENAPSLREHYLEKIEYFAKLFSGRLVLDETQESQRTNNLMTEAGLSLPKLLSALGLTLGVKSSMQATENNRKVIREIFKPRIEDLLALCNEMIHRLEVQSERRLLLIVDDLEKLKNLAQIRTLFLRHTHTLRQLRCQKLFTLPSYFPVDRELEVTVWYLWLAVRANPLDPEARSRDAVPAVREQLAQLIRRRIGAEQALVTDDALQLAIDYSGGNPRQYVEVLYRGTQVVRRYGGEAVGKEDVEEAVVELARSRTSTEQLLPRLSLLLHVRQHHLPPREFEPEDFFALLAGNQIFAYRDDLPWYGLDPLLVDKVTRYGKLYG